MFCVLDGHGGKNVVEYCEKVLPKIFRDLYNKFKSDMPKLFENIFKKVDAQLGLVGATDVGSTITMCVVRIEDD